MKTMYDVQQLLKRFGTFIYTGSRLSDLQLMKLELDEIYKNKLVNPEDYAVAKVILMKEIRSMQAEEKRSFQ